MDMRDLQGSSSEEPLKLEPEDSPPRTNQEPSPVGAEEVDWSQRLRRSDAEFWLGFYDSPSDSEEYQQLAHSLDLEAGNPTHSG